MKNTALVVLLAIIPGFPARAGEDPETPSGQWKAGAASAVITPDRPLRMAGYGGRKDPADRPLPDVTRPTGSHVPIASALPIARSHATPYRLCRSLGFLPPSCYHYGHVEAVLAGYRTPRHRSVEAATALRRQENPTTVTTP